MDRYIGLDVHAASSTVAIVSPAGKKLKNFVVETNGRAITEAIRMVAGKRHVILAEGTQSSWLHEIPQTHAEEVVVTRVSGRRGQKDDTRDAYALAEQLRIGAVERPIFKASGGYAALKALSRTHNMIGRDLVRVQNRIKSVYRSRGISTPGRSVYTLKTRKDCLARLPAANA